MSATPSPNSPGTPNSPTTTPPSKPTKPPSWAKRSMQIFAGIGLVGCLLFFGTPFATQYIVVNQLEQAGMTDVHVEPFSWRPWTPSISFGMMTWTTPDREVVALDGASLKLSWKEIFSRHIQVKILTLKGLKLPINLANGIQIAGLDLPQPSQQTETQPEPEASESPAWQISILSLQVSNTQIKVKGAPVPTQVLKPQEHTLKIDTLTVKEFSTLTPLEKSAVTFDGALDGLDFKIDADGAVLADSQSLNAQVDFPKAILFEQATQWVQPQLLEGIEGSANVDFNIGIDHQNTQAGRKIALQLNIRSPQIKSLLVKGLQTPTNLTLDNFDLDIGLSFGLAPPSFTAAFNAAIKADNIEIINQDIKASISDFWVQTQLHETEGQLTLLEQTNPNILTRVSTESISIESKDISPIASIKNFETEATLKDKRLNIPSLQLDQLFLLGEQKPILTAFKVEKLEFGRDELGEKSLLIDTITATNLTAKLAINADGSLETQNIADKLLKQINSILPQQPEELTQEELTPEKLAEANEEKTPVDKSPLQWQVNKFILQGENTIEFADNREGFGVEHKVDITKMTLTQLGLSNPTKVDLAADFKQGGNLEVNGQITLADLQANTNMNATLSNFAMPPLSPYIAPLLGYTADTGLFDAKLALLTQAGQGKSTLNIEAHKLEMTPADQETIASLTKELTMPLDLSLSLLKNKDDTIKLEIPIEMTSDGVNAEVGTVIRQALARATKNASLTYLKYALQPYGSLLLLAEKSGDLLNEMQLVNIQFNTMSAIMSEGQSEPAEKILTVLQQKPQLKIRLCPTATEEEIKDWPKEPEVSQQKALETLALQRAQSVKRYFREQDIAEKRLFICAPKIDSSGSGQVKISL